MKGALFLIPTTLGEQDPFQVLPQQVISTIQKVDYYIVENEKNARRFIKKVAPEKVQADLKLFVLNKHTNPKDHASFLQPIEAGHSIGIISDAGVPGVADPGAEIISLAHQKNITIHPLVGPSSILLAVMASGMNGQSFAFNGYLPIDKQERKKAIKELENRAKRFNQTQVFMETPYRNNKMIEDVLNYGSSSTLFTIACDITLESEFIKTQSLQSWKREKLDFHKRPCIFCIY
ncbi:16S rRNA (cytidine(1402)-2'-O)-methyltransferase [Flavobacteriaceae bacterium UJ101]|nr:16S rRNA (cytidine(1402)-2'-O)-methyltransferase [Flavobacteriaceae bacterium UJ101]